VRRVYSLRSMRGMGSVSSGCCCLECARVPRGAPPTAQARSKIRYPLRRSSCIQNSRRGDLGYFTIGGIARPESAGFRQRVGYVAVEVRNSALSRGGGEPAIDGPKSVGLAFGQTKTQQNPGVSD